MVALVASCPQHLGLKTARHGDCAWWAAAWTLLLRGRSSDMPCHQWCPHQISHSTKLHDFCVLVLL